MKYIKKFNESVNITDKNIEDQADSYMKDAQQNGYGDSEWQYSDVIQAFKEGAKWAIGKLNPVDTPNQKIEFTTLSSEEKEKMMSDALKLSEDQWMKKYPVGDHGDYLRMARTKWNID